MFLGEVSRECADYKRVSVKADHNGSPTIRVIRSGRIFHTFTRCFTGFRLLTDSYPTRESVKAGSGTATLFGFANYPV